MNTISPVIQIQQMASHIDKFGHSHYLTVQQQFNQIMQESYLGLPSRNTKAKSTVLTNVYQIRAERLANKYYLYTSPDKLDHLTQRRIIKHLKQHRSDENSLLQKIGFICFYKGGLLGSASLDGSQTLQLNEHNSHSQATVVLSKNGEIGLAELVETEKGVRFMGNNMHSSLKRILDKRQTKVTLHKFKNFVFQASCQIKLNFAYLNNKIWLTTDATHKVQEHITLLDYIQKYTNSQVSSLLAGAKIVKNYANQQQFFVVSIDHTKNPTNKISSNSDLTFQQYYLKKYNIEIKDLKQPLVLSSRRKTKKTPAQAEYLIPELVSLVGKSYMLDFPTEIQGQLDKLKQILPQQKESSISQVIAELGVQDIIKKSAINLDAYHLAAPSILLKNTEIQPEQGVFQFRNSIMQSPELRSWAIAYSTGTAGNEKEETENLINYFRNLTRIYGVNITNSPSTVAIAGSSWESWKEGLDQNFKKYGKLQIILLYLKEEQEKHYYPLKEYLTFKVRIPSQVIRKRTLHPDYCRKPYAIATDAIIQVITKVGAVPWDVKRENNALSQTSVMQGALTINRTPQGYAYYLVGSTGKEHNLIFSYFKKNLKSKQDFKADLQNSLMLWAKSYVVNCRSASQSILIYRKSTINTQQQLQLQRSAFFALGSKIGIKIKQQNYSPKMAFVNVRQQQRIEFYSKQLLKTDFVLKNVRSGTVMYEQSNSNKDYSFYLTSKSSDVATTKPVKYEVGCNNENINKEDLAQYTYESCYCYFNFQGAHSIPAMLQYSLKLNKLASKLSITTDTEDRLSKLFYYL